MSRLHIETEIRALRNDMNSAHKQIKDLNDYAESLESQIYNLQSRLTALERQVDILPGEEVEDG